VKHHIQLLLLLSLLPLIARAQRNASARHAMHTHSGLARGIRTQPTLAAPTSLTLFHRGYRLGIGANIGVRSQSEI
jgi:hypothetical protein